MRTNQLHLTRLLPLQSRSQLSFFEKFHKVSTLLIPTTNQKHLLLTSDKLSPTLSMDRRTSNLPLYLKSKVENCSLEEFQQDFESLNEQLKISGTVNPAYQLSS